MEIPGGGQLHCTKCGDRLGGLKPEALPSNSFTVVRCPSCEQLLALIFGLVVQLDEKVLSNSNAEIRAQCLHQAMMGQFTMLSEALAQQVADRWEEVIEANSSAEKKNPLEEIQQHLESMDIDTFNKYMQSLDPPNV